MLSTAIRRTLDIMKTKVPRNTIICGDNQEVLRKFPDNCIDLIITSPPYAEARKNVYGGVSPNKFVDWFLPKSE